MSRPRTLVAAGRPTDQTSYAMLCYVMTPQTPGPAPAVRRHDNRAARHDRQRLLQAGGVAARLSQKQGWRTALSVARGDECERARIGAPRRACAAVVRLRRAAAPLRAWVGVTVRVRGVPFFFDGPMLLITAAMLAAPLARVAGGAARRRLGHWSARRQYR